MNHSTVVLWLGLSLALAACEQVKRSDEEAASEQPPQPPTSSLPAGLEVRMRVNGSACPTVEEHQRHHEALMSGRASSFIPPGCVKLAEGTVAGKVVQTKRAEFAGEVVEFALIENQAGQKLWTLSGWLVPAGSGRAVAPRQAPSPMQRYLTRRFPAGVPIGGHPEDTTDLNFLTTDISVFTPKAHPVGSTFEVSGSLKLGRLPCDFVPWGGSSSYLVTLDAVAFAAGGSEIWHQTGYPIGDSHANIGGGVFQFYLVNSLKGDPSAGELVLIASTDPLKSVASANTRTVLGVKRLKLP